MDRKRTNMSDYFEARFGVLVIQFYVQEKDLDPYFQYKNIDSFKKHLFSTV